MTDYEDFSSPLNREPDGTYITVGQMKFFLNRKDGENLFKTADSEFLEYYNLCRVYNVVSDIMKNDEEAAIMYWDEKKQVVSMGFPGNGVVAKTLARIVPHESVEFEDDDEDGEDYGLLDKSPWKD